MITGTDINREDEIERERQAMVDDYAAGNEQQGDWHRGKMDELIRYANQED